MPGIYDICRSMRPKCPECGATLDVSALGNELFRRILKELRAGRRVRIERFGAIETYIAKGGKKMHTVYGEYKARKPFVFVRLKLCKGAKYYLNDGLAVEDNGGEPLDGDEYDNGDSEEVLENGQQADQYSGRESKLPV